VSSNNVSGLTYIKGILVVNKKYGIPSSYNPGANKVALDSYNKLKNDAKVSGFNINILSGFRSYNTQSQIYSNYVKQYGQAVTDTFSAKPGYSEHQTGLAFDVGSISNSYGDTPSGKWLANNCYKYGYIIRYPKNKQGITGYKYEPWHIRYVGVVTATKIFNSGLCLEEFLGI
ncbi:MAG: M15 family metallopeptidase, partial [Clostridia bacterium]